MSVFNQYGKIPTIISNIVAYSLINVKRLRHSEEKARLQSAPTKGY